MKREVKRYIVWVASFFAVLLLSLFLGRDICLNYLITRKIKEIENEKVLSIRYEDLHMKGLRQIELSNLTILPKNKDTLVCISHLAVRLDAWSMMKLTPKVENLMTEHMSVNFVKRDSSSNYDFLFRKSKAPAASVARDYGKRTEGLLNLLFNILPEQAEMQDLHIRMDRDGVLTSLHIPLFSSKDHLFSTDIELHTPGGVQRWKMDGELHPSAHLLRASLSAPEGKKVHVPGLKRWDSALSFHSLSFSVKGSRNGGVTTLSGDAEGKDMELVNALLSPHPLWLDDARMHYEVEIGKDYVHLTDRSLVRMNELEFNPSLRAEKKGEKWRITAVVDKPFFPAQQLFSSFPKGLFDTLEGIRAQGELAYHFLWDVNFANLDSLRFESELKKRNFRIMDFGSSGLLKLNAPFVYTAYDKGVPVRTFEVGPGNPGYLPLDSISPLLRTAVLQSEDGSFFSHRGFRMEALQEALIHDLKVGRFARGGSTISMQLVKNVFLNRNKNLLRKLEEALIVWLIENEGLSSKHRMYEVYLNICEWGPGVYGAREAARFYFDKEASRLTPEEAIFLASIVPKPKRYRSQFTAEGHLQPWLDGYFHTLARLMARSGVITEERAASIDPFSVRLTGVAARQIPTLPGDSLENAEEPAFMPELERNVE